MSSQLRKKNTEETPAIYKEGDLIIVNCCLEVIH